MNIEKFDNFFQIFSTTRNKLAESLKGNKKLCEDNALLRNVEAHLVHQLARTQENNLFLQKKLTEFSIVNEKTNNHKDALFKQESGIKALTEVLNELKAKVEKKVEAVTEEENLRKKLLGSEQLLLNQDGKYNLLRMEHQVLLKEKERAIKQIEEFSNAADKAKLECNMMKNELDRVHLTYSKQIMDLEQTIRNYRTTLKEITGKEYSLNCEDSNPEKILCQPQSVLKREQKSKWNKKNSVTWADTARREQLMSSGPAEEIGTKSNNEYNIMFAEEQTANKFKPKVKISRVLPTIVNTNQTSNLAVATPLEIYSFKDISNQPKKKKLYSSNSNHFTI